MNLEEPLTRVSDFDPKLFIKITPSHDESSQDQSNFVMSELSDTSHQPNFKRHRPLFPVYTRLWVSIAHKILSMALAFAIQLYILITTQFENCYNLLICTLLYQCYYIIS
jgi:hypothetical protein